MATSQVGGTAPASAIAQVGDGVSLPNANTINAGQSFSVVNDPVTVALGSMGAVYGGTGASLTYQESADFMVNVGVPSGLFLIDLLDSALLKNGFDSAAFQIHLNGSLFESQPFSDPVSAQEFFANNLIKVLLVAGPNDVQLSFSETMSSAGGFSFDYSAIPPVPEPPALPLFATGLGVMGLLGWRRKRKNAAAIVAA